MAKTAYVFPGQGSQSVGMLADFQAQYPSVKDTFAEASESISYDLWTLIQYGPEEKLNQTEHTQVAMLTADVAVYRALKQQDFLQPQLMAGHSLGEYAALVCAEALSLCDALNLVLRRAQIMQAAVPLGLGAMAAIVGLTEEQIHTVCEKASQKYEMVTPANYNAIGQVVISGHTPAVKRALILAEEAEARLTKIIPVSVPCHCPLLRDAAEAYAAYLAQVEFKKTNTALICPGDLSIYQSESDIRDKLKKQLYTPVRWVETIQLFKNYDIELVLECGPGKVLAGLIKRIDRNLSTISVYDILRAEGA